MSEENALSLASDIEAILRTGPLLPTRLPVARIPTSRVVELPTGSFHRVVFKASSVQEQNSALLLVAVTGQFERDHKAAAALALAAQLLKEPAFTALRTRETLGYIVSTSETRLGTGKVGGDKTDNNSCTAQYDLHTVFVGLKCIWSCSLDRFKNSRAGAP